jgi:hypothetical protein
MKVSSWQRFLLMGPISNESVFLVEVSANGMISNESVLLAEVSANGTDLK